MMISRFAGAFALLAAATLSPAAASATDFFVFKASITLPVSMVIKQPNAPTDLFVTRTVTGNDLVNLALGRPLGTKLDKNTEVFAVAITFPADAQLSTLIVFDPSQNGVAQVKATIGHLTTFEFTSGFKSNGNAGFAIMNAAIDPTVLGDPAHNGLLASTLTGGGSGSAPFGFGTIAKVSGKGICTGRVTFTSTSGGVTSVFDGLVTQGKGKASGKPIGTFSK